MQTIYSILDSRLFNSIDRIVTTASREVNVQPITMYGVVCIVVIVMIALKK